VADEIFEPFVDFIHLKESLTLTRIVHEALPYNVGNRGGIFDAAQMFAELIGDDFSLPTKATTEIDEL
jgi:hypothetical protein